MLDLLYILEYDNDPLKAELSIKVSAEFFHFVSVAYLISLNVKQDVCLRSRALTGQMFHYCD